ncbi:WXG100-like domain-containing protein [Nocardia terpenica]|uniref:RelA/SpoT domain-containing protein n=1 Tax=Nocardia terpenica TaxID=455432 RepID=A0A291RV43_9NOCA|nr:toxin glutamine deamidase domain-containing protein [Nocardia terpenica]ATL71416.1 hypothetical protein CRH09_01870 [Nocardia terpenica]
MGLRIPGELQWVAKYVVGAGDWPQGDETAMRRVAHAWRELATTVDQVETDGASVMREVLAAVDAGQTHNALDEFWRRFAGEKGSLPGVAKTARELADHLDKGAADIEHTKYAILAALAIFAVQMVQAAATAATIIGAPAAAAEEAAAQVATRVTIRMILKKLLTNMISRQALLKGAALGVAQSVGTDLGATLLQIAEGHRGGLTGNEWWALAREGVSGAIAGDIGAAAGSGGIGRFAVGKVDSKLAQFGVAAATDAAANVTGSVAGEATQAVLPGGKFEIDPTTLASSSLASSAALGGAHEAGTRSHEAWQSWKSENDSAAPHLETSSLLDPRAAETPGLPHDALPDTGPPVTGQPVAFDQHQASPVEGNVTAESGAVAPNQSGPLTTHAAGVGSIDVPAGATGSLSGLSTADAAGTAGIHGSSAVDSTHRPGPADLGSASAPHLSSSAPPHPEVGVPPTRFDGNRPDLARADALSPHQDRPTPRLDTVAPTTPEPRHPGSDRRTTSATGPDRAPSPTSGLVRAPGELPRSGGHPFRSEPPLSNRSEMSPTLREPLSDSGSHQPARPHSPGASPDNHPPHTSRNIEPPDTRHPAASPGHRSADNHARQDQSAPAPSSSLPDPGRPHGQSRPPEIAGIFSGFRSKDNGSHPSPSIRPGSSWDRPAPNDSAQTTAPHTGSDPARGRPPVEDKPYYANTRFHDPAAAEEYARKHPGYLDEARDIRSRVTNHPEIARLTPAEIAAIRHNQFMSLNEHVNRATRDGDVQALAEHDSTIRALVGAYNKLPDYHGTVYRGLFIDDPAKLDKFLGEYTTGNTVLDRGFASSDKVSSMGGNIELIIESHYGKDISWTGGQQNEVVFPPGHQFYVKNRYTAGNTYVVELTDLGRNPDDTRGIPADSGEARHTQAVGEPRRVAGTLQAQSRAGSAGPTAGHRGAGRDLAGMGRVGAETDRPGTGRDYGVDPENVGGQPNTPVEPPPDRHGFDPRSDRYVARFNDGRLIRPDPMYAGLYNPEIGRYQPTLEEIQAARAHPPGESPHDIQLRAYLAATNGNPPRPHDALSSPTLEHGSSPALDMRAPESLPRQRTSETKSEPNQVLDRQFTPEPGDPRPPAHPHRAEPHSAPPSSRAPHKQAFAENDAARAHQANDRGSQHESPQPAQVDTHAAPPDPRRAPQAQRFDHRPPFDIRRTVDQSGHPVTELAVRAYLDQRPGVSDEQMRRVASAMWTSAADMVRNDPRLLTGDRLRLDVTFVADPAHAHLHAVVDHSAAPGSRSWPVDITPATVARHLRTHLGLPAEHTGGLGVNDLDVRHLSHEIAAANTSAPLRGLAATREFGPGKLAPLEHPSYLEYVRDALRDGDSYLRWADPRTNRYGDSINDGGPEVPGRRSCCGDALLAGLSAFHGEPEIAHPRYPDRAPDGTLANDGPESGVIDRISNWLDADWQNFGHTGRAGFQTLHDLIGSLGPGASAAVAVGYHTRDPHTGELLYHADGSPVIEEGHGVLIVYPRDAEGPVWWDPQLSRTSDRPLSYLVDHAASLHAIPLLQDASPYVGRTTAHAGTSEAVPDRSVRHQPPIPDVPVRPRMGDLPDPLRRGDQPGPTHRPGEDGARRPQPGDHRIPQSPSGHGRRDLYDSGPGGYIDAGRPGVSVPDTPARTAHPGQPDHAGISDQARVARESPVSDRRLPPPDRQGHPATPTSRHHDDHGGIVDRGTPARRRDLAGTRDGRVLDLPPDIGRAPDFDLPDRAAVERYLNEPHVSQALDRANDNGIVTGAGHPVGDAVRSQLPQHPELARLMRDNPYLERSLLERPQALASLLERSDSIPILSEAAHSVAERGPESVLAEPVHIEPTPLTPEQRAVSDTLTRAVRDLDFTDRRQPGFDRARVDDVSYQREFLEQQYADWEHTQDTLNHLVRDIARNANGDPHWRSSPKSRQRAWDKVAEYGGDVSRLTDLVGAKIVFDRVADVYHALELVANNPHFEVVGFSNPHIEVVGFKDRFVAPRRSGYRDLLLNIRMSNGHIAELRLHLSHVDDVAYYEHALYEVQRDFVALAKQEHRELEPNERALSAEIQRRLNGLFWEATKKGLPDEFPPDTEHGPDGPEPDGPSPRPGPDGPSPRPAPDSGGAVHDVPDVGTSHSDTRSVYSDASNQLPGHDGAEFGRQVNTALDESITRQIQQLEEKAGAKRFFPGSAGREIREHLNSQVARLESGKRDLQELMTRIATDPEFDPVIADAWHRDGMKLAVRIPDKDGHPTTMMLIDRGAGMDPLLVPLRSPEHAIAVVAREARNDIAPEKLHTELRDMVGRPEEAQGHIAADNSKQALELGRRIFQDAAWVEEVRGQLLTDVSRAIARHLDLVPEKARDHFAEQGIKPRRNDLRDYERKQADLIQEDAAELRNRIDQMTEPGFDPRVYEAWRRAKASVTIQIKPFGYLANYDELLPRFQLLDTGSGHEPLLAPLDAPEHRLARIGRQLAASEHPAYILRELKKPSREVAELTAENREQAVALGREALLDRQISEELDSAAAAGKLGPEVDAIRQHLESELDRAASRWLDPSRRAVIGRPVTHPNEQEVQGAILRLRSRINENVRAGIDPEIYRTWSRDAAAIAFRVEHPAEASAVTMHDLGPERGMRLVPTRSGERELALIERELRNGTYPPDIVQKLDALPEHTDGERAADLEAAIDRGRSLLPETEAVRRQVQSSLEKSISESAQFEWKGNFEPSEEQLRAARLDHERSVEGMARAFRERVEHNIRVGIDPEVYGAWREAYDSVRVAVGRGDHVEHMTVLDLGPDREPRLVRSRSPEWELHRIERMAGLGESIYAVDRDLKAGPHEDNLHADSSEEAVELAREVLRQKKEAFDEINAMEQRSLDAARHAVTAGELGPAELPRHEQQIRADTQAIRAIADRLFERGIDPRIVGQVREMYDGRAEGILTHRPTIAGPPHVMLTLEHQPAVREPSHDRALGHDHTSGRDHEQGSRVGELEPTRMRELAEKRERELVHQQELARQRERELEEQRTREAAQEHEREQTRERERQRAQEREHARQEELARTRALRKQYERELARTLEAAPAREQEPEVARGPEHSPNTWAERARDREPEPAPVREPDRAIAHQLEHSPVREPERDETRLPERDRVPLLEQEIGRLVEHERQLMRERERDFTREQELDLLREREREQYTQREVAREQELVPLRQSILEREVEILQTRDMAHQLGEELLQVREPTNEARTPELEKAWEQVREPERVPAPEPITLEWRSTERQLGQLLSMVKRVEAPSPAIKVVITPTDVREAMARELDCPQEYWQHLVNSPEYQRWLALQREQQEQALAKTRARGLDANSRGPVRTR